MPSLLYVDKYRPRSLDELDYHEELSERIRALVRVSPRRTSTEPADRVRRLLRARISLMCSFMDQVVLGRRLASTAL
jgi:hypothetical protein